MKRNSLGIMAASILAVGVAHAQIGMQIETEKERRRKAFLDNECAATGQGCSMGPHGPNGEIQCQYCGREAKAADADLSALELRSLAHSGEVITKTDAAGNKVVLDIETWDPKSHPFSAPFDESHAFKGQGDIYAQAAAEIMKPGPDEPLPDRFSVNPESPFYDERWARTRIGVRFDGSDRPGDVEEYCVSEGWIRVQMFMKNGKVKRERGKIVCLKRHGKVEPYRK